MEKSAALRVCSAFVSVLLSILFVVMALVLPIYYSVGGLLLPKTITSIVQNINYVEIFKNTAEINQIITDFNVDSETLDEVMKSKEVGALLNEFSGELTTIVTDTNRSLDEVDSSFIQRLVDKHIDNIIPVIEEKNKAPIEKENLKQEITKVIVSKTDAIKQAVSNLEPVKQTVTTFSTVIKTVQRVLEWQYALIFGVVAAGILALIYLMRKKNFGGFIWIAVNTGIVGALLSVLAIASNSVIKILVENADFLGAFVNSAVNIVSTKLIIALVTCFAIMVLAIIACVVLRLRKRNLTTETA